MHTATVAQNVQLRLPQLNCARRSQLTTIPKAGTQGENGLRKACRGGKHEHMYIYKGRKEEKYRGPNRRTNCGPNRGTKHGSNHGPNHGTHHDTNHGTNMEKIMEQEREQSMENIVEQFTEQVMEQILEKKNMEQSMERKVEQNRGTIRRKATAIDTHHRMYCCTI